MDLDQLKKDIEFKKEFGMTFAQAYRLLDKMKYDNEKRYQDALDKAMNYDS